MYRNNTSTFVKWLIVIISQGMAGQLWHINIIHHTKPSPKQTVIYVQPLEQLLIFSATDNIQHLTYFLFTAAAGSAASCEVFWTFFSFLASLTLVPVGSGRSLTDLRDWLIPNSCPLTNVNIKNTTAERRLTLQLWLLLIISESSTVITMTSLLLKFW